MRIAEVVRRGLMTVVVTAGSLSIPMSADAQSCIAMSTNAYRDGSEVVATAEAQYIYNGDPCGLSFSVAYVELSLELETPSGPYYDYGYANYYDVATATVRAPIESEGWYVATNWAEAFDCSYFCELQSWDSDQDDYIVPTPNLALDGPVNPQQYGSYWIVASLDPGYLAPELEWQGCTPSAEDRSYCLFTAQNVGQAAVTASIFGNVSDQWNMNVVP
jgi:hypothetical protein